MITHLAYTFQTLIGRGCQPLALRLQPQRQRNTLDRGTSYTTNCKSRTKEFRVQVFCSGLQGLKLPSSVHKDFEVEQIFRFRLIFTSDERRGIPVQRASLGSEKRELFECKQSFLTGFHSLKHIVARVRYVNDSTDECKGSVKCSEMK